MRGFGDLTPEGGARGAGLAPGQTGGVDMATSDKRKLRDEALPVTDEVGGEGGSFADATFQQAAREGIRSAGLRRGDEPADDGAAGETVHRDEISGGGAGSNPDPAEGMKKYPTE